MSTSSGALGASPMFCSLSCKWRLPSQAAVERSRRNDRHWAGPPMSFGSIKGSIIQTAPITWPVRNRPNNCPRVGNCLDDVFLCRSYDRDWPGGGCKRHSPSCCLTRGTRRQWSDRHVETVWIISLLAKAALPPARRYSRRRRLGASRRVSRYGEMRDEIRAQRDPGYADQRHLDLSVRECLQWVIRRHRIPVISPCMVRFGR